MVSLVKIRVAKSFETLADQLREQILSGVILPGQTLPNERELGERTGLSRGSVREALRVLETQGLVATRLGRNGGRVAVQPDAGILQDSVDHFIRGQQVEFSKILETIEEIEPSLARLAARHRTAEDIALITALEDQLKATTNALKFHQVNGHWHLAVANASHNPLLIAIARVLGPRMHRPHVANFLSKSVRQAVIKAIGSIRMAIVAEDAEAAHRRMLRHMLAYREQVMAVAPKTVKL